MRRLPVIAVLAVVGVLGAGCRAAPDLSKVAAPAAAKDPDPTGRLEERREVDEETGRLVATTSVLVTPGRGAIKHGIERSWYAGGELHWEREFRFGKPTGAWRSWWENGNPRTECFYLGPHVERTMSFWREDGKLQAQGPASDGVRSGRWKFWWKNGRLSDEGEYRASMREGTWDAWSEDGTKRFEIVYARNVRVSKREVASAAPAAAPATGGP